MARTDFGITHPLGPERAGMGPLPPADRQLLEVAARLHRRAVLSVLRWRGIPPDQREDVAQNVFLRAGESLHLYDRGRELLPWLKKIAHRTATDHLRRLHTQRRKDQLAALDSPDPPDPRAPDEEHLLRAHDAPALLDRVLSSLTEEAREVFVMADIDGTPVAEIAESTGLELNTVRSRLARARQEVAAALHRIWRAEERRAGARVVELPLFLGGIDLLLRAVESAEGVSGQGLSRGGDVVTAGPRGSGEPTVDSPPPFGKALFGKGAIVRVTLARAALLVAPVFGAGVVCGGTLMSVWDARGDPRSSAVVRDGTAGVAVSAAEQGAAAGSSGAVGSAVGTGAAGTVGSAGTAQTAGTAPGPGVVTGGAAPGATLRERQENALIDKAQALFGAGKLEEGCAVLRLHEERYPAGAYVEQRRALWGAAGCTGAAR